MATKILTQERLKELLRYDPDTGKFFWVVSPRKNIKPDTEAGTKDRRGYVIISIDGRLYRAHRLVWLYIYGTWPNGEVDHINRGTSDNRLANLRVADRCLNTQNANTRRDNVSGHRGVGFHKGTNLWRARIQANRQKYELGYFADKESAIAAYQKAAKDLFYAGTHIQP